MKDRMAKLALGVSRHLTPINDPLTDVVLRTALRNPIAQLVSIDRNLATVAVLLMYCEPFRRLFMTDADYNNYYNTINNVLAAWNGRNPAPNQTQRRIATALGIRRS